MVFASQLPHLANWGVLATGAPIALSMWFNKKFFVPIGLYFIWAFMVFEPSGFGPAGFQDGLNNEPDESLVYHVFLPSLVVGFSIIGAVIGSVLGIADMLPIPALFRSKRSGPRPSARFVVFAFLSMLAIMFATHLTYALIVEVFPLVAFILAVAIPAVLYLIFWGAVRFILFTKTVFKGKTHADTTVLTVAISHILVNGVVAAADYFSSSDASWVFWVAVVLAAVAIVTMLLLYFFTNKSMRRGAKAKTYNSRSLLD